MKISPAKSAKTAWFKSHPVFVFLFLFSLVIIVFYFFYMNSWVQAKLFMPWINLNADISGRLLNLLGQQTTVYQDTISSVHLSISVKKGCDAVEPMALFVAGIISFPALWKKKLIGLAIGLPLIFFLNIVRIVALFLTGVFFPSLFELMHVEVWQVIFILVAIAIWFLWLRWSVKKKP